MVEKPSKNLDEKVAPVRDFFRINPNDPHKDRPTIQILTGEYDFVHTKEVPNAELGVRYILADGDPYTYVDLEDEASKSAGLFP